MRGDAPVAAASVAPAGPTASADPAGADAAAPAPATVVVVGASGGLGAAFVEALLARGAFSTVLALSRSAAAGGPIGSGVAGAAPALVRAPIDVTDEASIAAAAALARALPPVRRVLVASGLLHDAAAGLLPEKSMSALDAARLARLFAVNATGPALVARHFIPLMPRRGPVSFAALSARVGSLSDNRLGGWYGYRASKAALNMLLRTLAIEWARTAPDAVCVGLHPGTVDTALSAPFQARVAEGRLLAPARSAACLLDVLDRLGPSDSGRVFAWDGTEVPA
jgi:NAD(P)-dependent dehydrogenase (short-subunit alcohol dehydrogenase family)